MINLGIIILFCEISFMFLILIIFIFIQLTASKAEHEGSVVAEVGSEKCESEGHDTDIENTGFVAQNKDLETLKGTFVVNYNFNIV